MRFSKSATRTAQVDVRMAKRPRRSVRPGPSRTLIGGRRTSRPSRRTSQKATSSLLLDVREPHEWDRRQVSFASAISSAPLSALQQGACPHEEALDATKQCAPEYLHCAAGIRVQARRKGDALPCASRTQAAARLRLSVPQSLQVALPSRPLTRRSVCYLSLARPASASTRERVCRVHATTSPPPDLRSKLDLGAAVGAADLARQHCAAVTGTADGVAPGGAAGSACRRRPPFGRWPQLDEALQRHVQHRPPARAQGVEDFGDDVHEDRGDHEDAQSIDNKFAGTSACPFGGTLIFVAVLYPTA